MQEQFNRVFHRMKYERGRPIIGNTNISQDKGMFLFFVLIHPTCLCLSFHLLVCWMHKRTSHNLPYNLLKHYILSFLLFQPLITQNNLVFAPHAQILLWYWMAKKIPLSPLTWAKAMLAYKISDYKTNMQNCNLIAHLHRWLIAPTKNVL